MENLKDIGEDALISRLVKSLDKGGDVVVGPGDDCAVIDVGDKKRYQLLKTDCIVEGVHFLPEAPAEQVGWKAVARVISDFAAMGGEPSQLLITLVMPENQQVTYVEKLYEGMQRCATAYGAAISGGETSSLAMGSAAVISISGTGWVDKDQLVRRDGGKPDDVIMVTGQLGGSIKGKHLTFTPRLEEAKWLVENFQLHSMMDLSDGLAKDLPRLAKLSQCGYMIHESAVPCSPSSDLIGALGDGEDYELLMSVSAEGADAIELKWKEVFPELSLTAIGRLTDDPSQSSSLGKGWEHFTE